MKYLTGMIVNVVTVCWLVFAIVFFSFPYYQPVTGMFCSLFSFPIEFGFHTRVWDYGFGGLEFGIANILCAI
jgi:hypothetical protein